MILLAFGRLENIVRRGRNAGYQHCPLFQMFQKAFPVKVVKIKIMWKKLNPLPDDKF